ncbi:hypothetical protein ACL7TT_20045 [Microbulbifer sp. 2304DJ12-6]|uniref:hypothetical protein n=1 Tax=Microbulbifer sp. 2304DJ12-6 TaxID=3233340 RepID=UPI0039AFEDF3
MTYILGQGINMAVDVNGKKVVVGSKVKVLYINPRITEFLPEEEVSDINSMLHDILDVYEVSDNFVKVEKVWGRGEGRTESHRLTLSSGEIELVGS